MSFWKSMGLLVMMCVAFGTNSLYARDIPFSADANVHYDLNAEPLPQFVENFLAENGFRGVLSEQLKADKRTLNGVRQGTPSQVFNSILASNQLMSYYDGAIVFVYLASEILSRFQPLPFDKANGFRAALQRMALDDTFNRTRIDSTANLIEITGVPRYVEQVHSLLSAVVQRDVRYIDFRFFPLRYAWASDRTFVVAGRQVVVPGVANVLRQLVQNGSESQRIYASSDSALPSVAPSMRGQGLANRTQGIPSPNPTAFDRNMPVPPPIHMPSKTPQANALDTLNLEIDAELGDLQLPAIAEVSPLSDGTVARIVADPQRNAIIVRDRPESMSTYENLIRKLDVPSQVIEIEATIIDVNTDKLKAEGVDWRYGTKDHDISSGEADVKEDFLSVIAGDSIARMTQIPGMQAGAIIGDERRFVARLNVLEREGFVKVASRPKVVTLNDLEAVLESSRSVYVPVQGAYDVDLFKVFAGTVLRVTPHVIDDLGNNRIRLIISAEDGAVDDTTNEKSPSVTRNAVSTQAVIEGNTSLLLGGLSRTESVNQVRKVPLLGDIPLLGALFRSESRGTQNSERLFLISPRVLRDEVAGTVMPDRQGEPPKTGT